MITFIILIIILILLIIISIITFYRFSKNSQKNTFLNGGKKNNTFKNNVHKNILGTDLIPCCDNTGFNRDGMCSSNAADTGTHIICAIVDDDFLEFTKSRGNDLITPSGAFPGLVAGDKWCLCALRWLEAHKEGKAPKIIPESTNELALKYITF